MPSQWHPQWTPPQAGDLRSKRDSIMAGALAGARAAQQAVAPTPPAVPPVPEPGGPAGMPGDLLGGMAGMGGVPAPPPAPGPMLGDMSGGMPPPQVAPPQAAPPQMAAPAPMPQLGPPPELGPNVGMPAPAPMAAPMQPPLQMAEGGVVPEMGASTGETPPGVIPAHVVAEIAMRAMKGENPAAIIQEIAGRGPGGVPDASAVPTPQPSAPTDDLPAPPDGFTRWLSMATPDATNEFGQALLAAYQAQPEATARLWALVQAQAKRAASELPPELRTLAGVKERVTPRVEREPPPVPSAPMRQASKRN